MVDISTPTAANLLQRPDGTNGHKTVSWMDPALHTMQAMPKAKKAALCLPILHFIQGKSMYFVQ